MRVGKLSGEVGQCDLWVFERDGYVQPRYLHTFLKKVNSVKCSL